MSTDASTDRVRNPTFADGMSKGQARMIGTTEPTTNLPARPRCRHWHWSSGAPRAQEYAERIARKSQPAFSIDQDLASSTTVSDVLIVTDPGPLGNRSDPPASDRVDADA